MFLWKHTQHKIYHLNRFRVSCSGTPSQTVGQLLPPSIHLQNSFALAKLEYLQHYLLFPLTNNSPFCPWSPATAILLSVSVNLTTLVPSQKWNHTVFAFLQLVTFTQYNVLKAQPCWQGSEFSSFLRLSNIPLYAYTTTCLFIYPSRNPWVAFSSWLL